ncbi:formyltransferase family protein [Paraburkholderia sp. D15]|uniref:formyltransferase family protein n=1 Tax=Paraburkholderia sp. D15 TaxID=2880218 RepID=UPI0024783B46|nr:formyltransferase family protein [Paraburkholderia sp. D15]WGS54151.1 formyltransferase family protein [Paraburkholderia sp. D15]
MKKLTLFLMTKKGYTLLADLIEQFHPLFEVVVIGRDASLDNDYHDEIAGLCAQYGLRTRERMPDAPIDTEFAMAVSWRWMIDFPAERLIVFHDSLLPRYRGFNPLVSCLINGEARVGVTALLGAKHYDAGPVLAQSSTQVAYPCTIARAIDLIAVNYRETAECVLRQLEKGDSLNAIAQDEHLASFSLWRDDEDYQVRWARPADWLARFIDAVGAPYKGALTLVDGKPARILAAQALPDVRIENREAGKVIWMDGAFPVVVCGEGLLRVTELIDDDTGASLLPLERFRVRFA